MLINEALAGRDFPNRNPIGETVFINYFPEPWQIVGVVADVRQFGLALEPQPQFFVDLRQWTDVDVLVFPAGAYYAVRTEPSTRRRSSPASAPSSQQLDPQASLFYVAPMEQVVASTISRPRLYATLLGHLLDRRTWPRRHRYLRRDELLRRAADARDRHSRRARRDDDVQVIALVVGQSAVLTAVGIRARAFRRGHVVALSRRVAVRRHAARPDDVCRRGRALCAGRARCGRTGRRAVRPASIRWWRCERSDRVLGGMQSAVGRLPLTVYCLLNEDKNATIRSSTAQCLPRRSRRAGARRARWIASRVARRRASSVGV